jgi:hypothetical protein
MTWIKMTMYIPSGESPLLGSPLIDHVVKTDILMGHLLQGLTYNEGDAFLVCRDDHIIDMDTSIWDPSTYDISRVSAQEDTTVHIGCREVHIEATI